MKLTLTTLTILFTLSLNAQSYIGCSLNLNFTKDSTSIIYSLQAAGNTQWTPVLNLGPQKDSKEGWIYDEWIPIQTNIKPVSDFLTTFIGTQYRKESVSGVVEVQAKYCVYVLSKTESIKK